MLYSKAYALDKNQQPVLIILHGLLGSSTNWHSMAGKFSDSHRVYALDLRNHGRSAWFDEHSYPAMAQDVADFIKHNKLDQVSLLGHSMGGKAAMQLALSNPELINKLIVADIAPVTYADRGHADLISAMQHLPLAEITSRKTADAALKNTLPDPGVRAFLLQNLVFNETEKAWQWRLNLAVLLKSLTDIMAFATVDLACALPGLFVYGKNSDYVTKANQAAIETLFPASQIVGLDDAGHWLHAEQPTPFYKACANFL